MAYFNRKWCTKVLTSGTVCFTNRNFILVSQHVVVIIFNRWPTWNLDFIAPSLFPMGKAGRVTILAFHAVLLKVNDKRKTLLVLKTNRFDD